MRAAAGAFVCAADEVWRLQRGSEPDCVFFQQMVNGGRRITDRGSRQGLWVLAPGAGVLARCNTRNVETVLAAMRSGLERWDALDDAGRSLPSGARIDTGHRWEQSYPEGGLVLERVARELVGGDPRAERSPRWNRDYAWFSADEIAGLLPDDVALGDRFELPLLAERLARFHLVDDVRGQTLPFAPAELRSCKLEARLVALEGSRAELELRGESAAEAGTDFLLDRSSWTPRKVYPHGMHTRMAGVAQLDLEAGRFTRFELVALGSRHGRTQHNGRGRDDAPGRVAFHFTIAPPRARLAPTFAGLYGVDWIDLPAVPTWLESPEECGLEPPR